MLLKGTFCPYSVEPTVPKDLRSNAAVGFLSRPLQPSQKRNPTLKLLF